MKNAIKLQLITPNQAQAALDIYAYYVNNTSITFETEVPSLEEIGVFKSIGHKQGQWHSAQWFQKSLGQTELIPTQPKSMLEISGSAELREILRE